MIFRIEIEMGKEDTEKVVSQTIELLKFIIKAGVKAGLNESFRGGMKK